MSKALFWDLQGTLGGDAVASLELFEPYSFSKEALKLSKDKESLLQPKKDNAMSEVIGFLLSKITGESFESIEDRFIGKGYGEFKKEVAEAVAKLLSEIQERYNKFNNEKVLDEILNAGSENAKIVANKKLKAVTTALGLN